MPQISAHWISNSPNIGGREPACDDSSRNCILLETEYRYREIVHHIIGSEVVVVHRIFLDQSKFVYGVDIIRSVETSHPAPGGRKVQAHCWVMTRTSSVRARADAA